MANYYINTENQKGLREAFNHLNIKVYDVSSGSPQLMFDWDRDDIISCNLDLRCVNTDINNPSLEVSTIDIEVYYTGSRSLIMNLLGTETEIKYTSGYDNDGTDDISTERTFYCTFSDNTVSLKNKVLKIKGTDSVGAKTDEYKGKFYKMAGDLSVTYWNPNTVIDDYVQDLVKPFISNYSAINFGNRIYANTTSGFRNDQLFWHDRGSYRKLIAQWMNFFRGSNPSSPDGLAKRFVFRDAGIPSAGWAKDAISAWPTNGNEPAMQTWNLSYNEVADLEVQHNDSVKELRLDNPFVNNNYDTLLSTDEKDLVAGSNILFDSNEPVWVTAFSITTGSTITRDGLTILDPHTAIEAIGGSGTGKGKFFYHELGVIYASGQEPPNVVISTGLKGNTITLDQFIGLNKLSGWYLDSSSNRVYFDLPSFVGNALEHGLNDCNLKQPRWIDFTWRGHPNMQPRDMLLFTEQDGTKNYYEIDNLTLEHKNGGLISKVRAIYKCPYTS